MLSETLLKKKSYLSLSFYHDEQDKLPIGLSIK